VIANGEVADRSLHRIECPINSTRNRRLARSGLDSIDADQVADRWSHWIETSGAVFVGR
jgi:hypothetical protein